MNQTDRKSVTVLGASGKTGRRVVERLEAKGIEVQPRSRSSRPPFDWKDPAGWPAALEGSSAVYISYYPDVAAPGAPEELESLATVAVEGGVERLVLLSGRGEDEAQRAEQLVQAVAGSTTVVRCSWFAQNFDEGYMLDPVRGGVVALPAVEVAEPFIDAEDIADVAVAALTETGHEGKIYELTGPRLMTFSEAVDEIAQAAGREISYVPISLDEYAAGAAAAGIPEDVVALLRYLFGEVLDGRNASLGDGVERALGRPPGDFTDYARAAAATGVWDV